MGFVVLFIYFVLPVICAGYFYLKKKYSFFGAKGISFVKPNSWILGSFGEVRSKIHLADFYMKSYEDNKEKGAVTGFFSMFTPLYIINDLELVKNITVKDFNYFSHRGIYVNEEADKISGHLFSLDGEKWRFLRNKLSPVFTSGKIKMMYETISGNGVNLVKAIDEATKCGSVDMKEMSIRFTVDSISSCAFGMESNTLKNEHPEFLEFFKDVNNPDGSSMMKSLFISVFPKLSKFLNLRLFLKKTEDFISETVGGTINFREKNKIERNDFLNILIQLKNKGSIDGEISGDSRKLTFDDCLAQAFIFFFAGADTSSTTIAYAMIQLGLHPEIQEKLRDEILENSSDKITYDNLQEMTYLNKVINETLRLFPPAFFILRQATKDYHVPNSKLVIDKGSQVFIPTIAIHQDERYYKNPKEFNPERFSAEEISKRPNLAFMPFGDGQRNCIGMRFGLLNVKFAVATIIKNFKVTVDDSKTILPLKFDSKAVSIEPKGGFHVKFEKINVK